jgi:hypothetical protein
VRSFGTLAESRALLANVLNGRASTADRSARAVPKERRLDEARF